MGMGINFIYILVCAWGLISLYILVWAWGLISFSRMRLASIIAKMFYGLWGYEHEH
jgi:hypothetical protein